MGNSLFSLFYKRYTRTNILSFFDISPSFSTHLFLWSTSFLMPPSKNVFSCAWSHVCTMPLNSSAFANWHTCNTQAVWKYGNQMGVRIWLYAGWGKSLNFHFQIVSIVAAAIWGWALLWCRTTPFVSIPLCLLQIVGFTFSLSIAQYCALLSIYAQGWA